MISMLAMACVIFYSFSKLILTAMVTKWDIQPIVIYALLLIAAVRLRHMIHARLI